MKTAEEILKDILNKRGISSEEDISEFLSDRPRKTYDPFLLLNMEAGVDLLLSEINSGKRICIYGDYDADGVTSVCILSHVLGMLTDNFTYYIPSRFSEGYGLNMEAVSRIKDDGADLIITVDCGSVSYEEVEYAKRLGMKVIVTDHHSIEDVKADCILINPKQKECGYPFRELAGCGIAFKMVQAICRKTGLPKSVINDVLDLTAIGTVGDIVALTDENRTIVKYGLMRINEGRRKSLKRLAEAISLRTVTSENIAFGIAPHINAAGRMAHAKEAVELFLAEDSRTIETKVAELVRFNNERKAKQNDAYERCMEKITGAENFIVLDMDDIHEGIAGIVAGKIKETLNRPVIIVTPSGEGDLKGTGRSVENIDIFALLKRHDSLFKRFGGHRSACGFLMKKENLEILRNELNREVQLMLDKDPHMFDVPTVWDETIIPGELTMELAKGLEKLQPYGQANPKPVFRMCDVTVSKLRFMGADDEHAGFTAVASDGSRADCILFRTARENADLLSSGGSIDITGTINIKEWMGRESVQFVIEEVM